MKFEKTIVDETTDSASAARPPDSSAAESSVFGLHETTIPGRRAATTRRVKGKPKDMTPLPMQPRRSVSGDELSYLREHLREALQDDAVVCLDCGARRRALGGHVRVHDLTLDEYRERWGYNRKTPLVSASSAEKYRQNAFDRNLGAYGSAVQLTIATEASRHADNTRRREGVLRFREAIERRLAAGWPRKPHYRVDDDTLRTLAEAGRTRKEIATLTGLGRHQLRKRLQALQLLPPPRPSQPTFTDQQLLKLRTAGLWPSEIAARLGTTAVAVRKRVRKLRRQGVVIAEPGRPAPNGRRRVSSEAFLTLVRKGLSLAKIAARLGVQTSYVIGKKNYLRKRGLIERSGDWRRRTFTDQELLELCATGLWPSEIAVQLGTTPLAVRKRIRKLRRQGIVVAEPDQLRPQPNGRRMPNAVFLTLARQGLPLAEVAARLGVSKSYVKAKATYLRRRGLLERSHTWQQQHAPRPAAVGLGVKDVHPLNLRNKG